jgi:hypothetical protein
VYGPSRSQNSRRKFGSVMMTESNLIMKRIATRIMEMLLFDLQREQEEEDKQWTEEYYRRRHDLYWKNDSEYD